MISEAQARQLFANLGEPFPERPKQPASDSIDDEMNKTERAYAAYLESRKLAGEIVWYGYACLTLRLAKRTHFRVDFAVVNADGGLVLIDVKGSKKTKRGATYFAREDAKLKIKVAARLFPCFSFKIAWRDGSVWCEEEMPR